MTLNLDFALESVYLHTCLVMNSNYSSPARDGTSGDTGSGIVGVPGPLRPSNGSRENSESGEDPRTSYGVVACPIESKENIEDAYDSVSIDICGRAAFAKTSREDGEGLIDRLLETGGVVLLLIAAGVEEFPLMPTALSSRE